MTALLAAAREPFRPLIRAMANNGCRPDEICGLAMENCFPDEPEGEGRGD